MQRAIERIIKEMSNISREIPSPKPFNITRRLAELTRSDPLDTAIPEARTPQAIEQKGNTPPSSQWQDMIKNAHRTMFRDRNYREFSTSSHTLSERPKSIVEFSPPEELKNRLKNEQEIERKKVAGQMGKDLKELEQDLTSIVSNYLKSTEICRRFTAEDFIRTMTEGKVKSTDEKYEHIIRSFLNLDEDTKKKVLEESKCTESDFLKEIECMKLGMQAKKEMQECLFQYEHGTPNEKRPIHAIATTDPYGEFDNKYLEFFGKDIAVFFNESLKIISTVVGNDTVALVSKDDNGSMRIIASPEPLANPTHNIFPLELETKIPHRPSGVPTRYFEVHIHRMLMNEGKSLGPQHMTRVVIGDPISLGQITAQKVKKLCDKHGIACDIGKNKEDSMRLRKKHDWIEKTFR